MLEIIIAVFVVIFIIWFFAAFGSQVFRDAKDAMNDMKIETDTKQESREKRIKEWERKKDEQFFR